MKTEYGSEFMEKEPQITECSLFQEEQVYEYLLGRTALDAIVQDATSVYEIKKVLLPSYCCHTMIHPFLKRGLRVEFYDVVLAENGGLTYCIDFEKNFDAILIMQYFGFYDANVLLLISRLKACGKIVIEDATHSILQPLPYSKESDYVFASYRKWMAVRGGAIVIKRAGAMEEKADILADSSVVRNRYLAVKNRAIADKKDYFEKGRTSEKTYLTLFHEAELMIEDEYAGFDIDEESAEIIRHTDYERIKTIRRNNAKCLMDGLGKLPHMKLLFREVTDWDVPLFVPICMKEQERQILRQYLISNHIYLPIHWPMSELHDVTHMGKELFKSELSVICDQRYDVEDMKHITLMISKWAETRG